jgi:hypothetical protein
MQEKDINDRANLISFFLSVAKVQSVPCGILESAKTSPNSLTSAAEVSPLRKLSVRVRDLLRPQPAATHALEGHVGGTLLPCSYPWQKLHG